MRNAGCFEIRGQQSGRQEGFLQCQTPTSAVRLKVEGGKMRIESEEQMV